jgi:PAS domain-containing protein
MTNEPTDPAASGNAPGVTMRIDLSPEMIEEAKRGKTMVETRRKTGTDLPVAKVMAGSVTGGIDFQQLLQNIYDAVLITDLNGEIIMANVRANQFFLSNRASSPARAFST